MTSLLLPHTARFAPTLLPTTLPILSRLSIRCTTITKPWKNQIRSSPFSSTPPRPSPTLTTTFRTPFTTYRPPTTLTSPLCRPCVGGYQARSTFFHATRPAHGVHAFRLANFVAPIVMRQIREWIGTPSTNVYFMRNLAIFIAVLLGIPAIYIYTHLERTPYTERTRFVALTSEDEHKIAEMAFDQLIDTHEADFIPEQHRFVSHVTEVADRIIAASNRPDINWEVRLIDSPVHNAFAIPGGKIFVFSGLLDVTKNDDGLAFILGHEVAHVLARHSAEQMTVGRLMLGVSVFVSAIFGDNIGSFFLSRVISLLTELTYSRSMEREADYIGLLLMQQAKYNIDEAPKVWERMMKLEGQVETNAFFSTHPSHSERIHDLTKWVEELKTQKKVIGA